MVKAQDHLTGPAARTHSRPARTAQTQLHAQAAQAARYVRHSIHLTIIDLLYHNDEKIGAKDTLSDTPGFSIRA